MRHGSIRVLAVVSAILGYAVAASADPPRAIPFQAVLKTAVGVPVTNASQPITVALYAVATGGTAVYSEAKTVSVTGGLLATTIGDGDPVAFAAIPFNVPYYVGVKVGTDPEMTPRVQLSAVPYANYAASVAPGALNGASWTLSGNSGTDPATQFIGTIDNQPLVLKSNGFQAMRLTYAENATGQYRGANVLGGSQVNSIANVVGATISGGGMDSVAGTDLPNSVTGEFGTVGGGYGNTSGQAAFVGGGLGNTASGVGSAISGGSANTASNFYTAVGGGQSNQAPQQYTTVAGGRGNKAQGDFSTIGGGRDNTTGTYESVVSGGRANQATGGNAAVGGGYANIASGSSAVIPGGDFNAATGAFSFAAGLRAKSNHDGTFVWGDNTAADFTSTGVNQFLIRAGGGVGINTNAPLSMLDVLGDSRISGAGNGLIFPDGTKQTTAAAGGGSGWSLTGNAGTNPGSNFIGTTDNQPFTARVNNSRSLFMQYVQVPDSTYQITSVNIANGYGLNAITPGVAGATIAGGGIRYTNTVNSSYVDNVNTITDHYGTIGGGSGNTVGNGNADLNDARGSTIAGGVGNQATKRFTTVGGGTANFATGDYDTVAGGWNSQATGGAGFIGGGWNHRMSGQWAVIGGGYTNSASGAESTVPGGANNTAAGIYSFAAGNHAKANHDGAFVWGDSGFADFASTNVNQFLIRASGGVGIGTNAPGYPLDVQGDINARGNVRANGVVLSSDSRYKTNVRTLDNALGAVLNLRGVSFDWNRAKWPEHGFADGPQVGFIAQEVEKVLPELVSADAQGYKSVAYANIVPITVEAIKAQQREIQEKDARIAVLEAKAARVDELEARLTRLEQLLNAKPGPSR
ncbi:MAG TPA: tail fiber domain-containing protein [Armatimonadota bacterium]|jgi:hypothetical protein